MSGVAHTRPEREAIARSPEAQREHERSVVAEHYQHEVEIFSMVLDSRLAYATGVFARPDEDLETAQDRKFGRIQAKLDIKPGERVFDVGCGWGSNLLYLAEHTEGRFYGITLSERQREEALRRARLAGVADRVNIEVRHVEDLAPEPASFDVVLFSGSIVHMHNREAIHRMVSRILRPGGRLLISDCYLPGRAPRRSRERGDAITSSSRRSAIAGSCTSARSSRSSNARGSISCTSRISTSSYAITLERWIDNVRKNRRRIEEISPGFSRLLQQYMTVAKLSFARRTALEYMILATKGRPAVEVSSFPIVPASSGGSAMSARTLAGLLRLRAESTRATPSRFASRRSKAGRNGRWARFWEEARRVEAGALRGAGLRPGDRVLVLVPEVERRSRRCSARGRSARCRSRSACRFGSPDVEAFPRPTARDRAPARRAGARRLARARGVRGRAR